jgi:RNA polymerase sigma-70 factor (ECF subfamily)
MKRQLSIAALDITTDMTTGEHGMNYDKCDDERDDNALMASIAAGDRNAFNTFLSHHLSAVVQFARRYLSEQADAEDIAQETFFRVWRKAATWQSQGHSPRSWLYRIAYNLCIDEIRRRPTIKLAIESATESEFSKASDNTVTNIERDSEIKRLAHSLKELPERQRTAISLCAIQGLTNKEASTVMEISIEALESLLSRGRRQLRSRLQQEGEITHD